MHITNDDKQKQPFSRKIYFSFSMVLRQKNLQILSLGTYIYFLIIFYCHTSEKAEERIEFPV